MADSVLTQRQRGSQGNSKTLRNDALRSADLRDGYTTGTCAAAAAACAAHLLKTGELLPSVVVETPAGVSLDLSVSLQWQSDNAVCCGIDAACCGVLKDGGDDPDITNGALVTAAVRLLSGDEAEAARARGGIVFAAGEGVGTVTKQGLKIPVGEPAINPVPREMITKEIRSRLGDVPAEVTVGVVGGETLARRTFNSRLGIEGGLSILGTTGIVRPMSEQAILDTIAAELSVKAAASREFVILTFGAMGENELMRRGYDGERMVQVSNFIGFALDEAVRLGFGRALIAGHAGKLVKVAAGVFNTHSAVADARMETLCAYAALEGADLATLRAIMDCATTQAVGTILNGAGIAKAVWRRVEQSAASRAAQRTGIAVEALVLDGD